MREKQGVSKHVSQLSDVKSSLGYQYFAKSYRAMVEHGCTSRLLRDLEFKTRRADHVLHIFHAWYARWESLVAYEAKHVSESPPPTTIPGLFKHTNFLRSLLFNSGCRCFRAYVAFRAFELPGTSFMGSGAVARIKRKMSTSTGRPSTNRASSSGGAAALTLGERMEDKERRAWFEKVERGEIETLNVSPRCHTMRGH